MGGNVFSKTHNVERIDQNTLEIIKSELSALFEQKGISYYFVKSVLEKNDHGDVDVLVNGDISFIARHFSIPSNTNGDVTSVLYKEKYQIDFIKTDEKEFKISALFYDYNDFGNLIGRLIKKAGYKLTPKGLYYVYKGLYKNTEILLSQDPNDVLNILQLDVCQYHKGFSTFIEMFEYVAKCPTFCAYPYRLENLSNSDRARDKKRKTYMMFIDWLDKSNVNERSYGNLIAPRYKYPKLVDIISDLESKDEEEKAFRNVFNGNNVSQMTGYTGKTLGDFMSHMKSVYSKDDLQYSLKESVEKEINTWMQN